MVFVKEKSLVHLILNVLVILLVITILFYNKLFSKNVFSVHRIVMFVFISFGKRFTCDQKHCVKCNTSINTNIRI
jgi:hypothetical protein